MKTKSWTFPTCPCFTSHHKAPIAGTHSLQGGSNYPQAGHEKQRSQLSPAPDFAPKKASADPPFNSLTTTPHNQMNLPAISVRKCPSKALAKNSAASSQPLLLRSLSVISISVACLDQSIFPMLWHVQPETLLKSLIGPFFVVLLDSCILLFLCPFRLWHFMQSL